MNKEDVMSLFEFYNNGSGSYLSNSSYNEISNVVDKIMILYKLETAELQAKVYTYEKIIANSNFKAILEEPKSSTNKEIPQFEGTLEQLEKLSIRGEDNGNVN